MTETRALYNANDVMTETELQSSIIEKAQAHGWAAFHAPSDTRRQQPRKRHQYDDLSGAGFPDLVLRRGQELLVIECKKEDGKLSADQERWGSALLDCGVAFLVIRPSALDALAGYLEKPTDWVGLHDPLFPDEVRERVLGGKQ